MTKKEMLLNQNEKLVNEIEMLQSEIIEKNHDAYVNCYRLKNVFWDKSDLFTNHYGMGIMAFKSYSVAKINDINNKAIQVIEALKQVKIEVIQCV